MKYKFKGIGQTGAAMILAALAANPSTVFLTQGPLGKILFYLGRYLCEILANYGLIVMNVGAARIETLVDEKGFDGSFDEAQAIINRIRQSGRDLTDEEIKAIDTPVIDAFRRFASFARVRDGSNPRL